jgi:hypothetical protein
MIEPALQTPLVAAVAVFYLAVDLQTARQPGRHPHLTQAQFLVDEVEIVVQALAIVRP